MDKNRIAIFKKIVKKHGSPSYVYDAEIIIKKYKKFINAFNVKQLKIHYACKALPSLSILSLFKNLGANLDCVSIEEVLMGLEAGFSPADIIFTPNGVSIHEYEEAILLGVNITVDNLSILEQFGIKFNKHPIFLRINPHILAGGNKKISVGHVDSKFGISIHQLPHVLRIIDNLKMNIEGIHVHTGSDILESNIFLTVSDIVFSLVKQFPTVKSVDFGGGFRVKYNENETEFDIDKFGKKFTKDFNERCKKIGRNLVLRFEPGKFLVSEAGYFLTTVNVIKQTTSCTFVSVNSGFNHLIRPMFYNAYHEIINISNPNGRKKIYSVVGNICETDTFAEDRILNLVRENDILLFMNAGAYGFSMSSNYNSRLKPPEVILYKGKDYLIRKRETFNDLLSNQIRPKIQYKLT